jgi:hypothetical protein
MTVRELMKQLIELDPEMRVGVTAHSSGCDIDNIMVRVNTGKPNHIAWRVTPSKRPRPTVNRDFAFEKDGEPICVISG